MIGYPTSLKIFGTDEITSPTRLVKVGDLSLEVELDAIRAIRWKGVEAVSGIYWPIRDSNWIALEQENVRESLTSNGEKVEFDLKFSIAKGMLNCELSLNASKSGFLELQLLMIPQVDFKTNRSGFAVLHPIFGVAGKPLAVTHSDGSRDEMEFPLLISPGQPVFDIAGLRHEVEGVVVDISFDGEIFEMEDQRNWSDASYKTYCRPLVFPFTYTLRAGKTVRQSIAISLSGSPSGARSPVRKTLALDPVPKPFPDVGLALENGWMCSSENNHLVAAASPKFFQVRIDSCTDSAFLREVARFSEEMRVEIDLEVVVAGDRDVDESLRAAADALAVAGVAPSRVLPLPEGYLTSHQPTGPWPKGATPAEAVAALRRVFPDAMAGGGVLTNFTEFNRHPPNPELCDFVSHGMTAIVHVADDRSVVETLESYPSIFASAEALAKGRPYRLGLVSIGMRSNPYGPAVADNPDMKRQIMAMHDPRHRGLFAAAWIVGALAKTEGHEVEAVSLGAPSGPFAIVFEHQSGLGQGAGESGSTRVLPMFHPFRAAAAMSRKRRLAVSGLPDGVFGIAVEHSKCVEMILANLSETGTSVVTHFADGFASVLSDESFANAVSDEDWITRARQPFEGALELPAFGVGFISAKS